MASAIFKSSIRQQNIAIRFLGGEDRISNSMLPYLKENVFISRMWSNISFNITEADHKIKFEHILSELLTRGYKNNPKLGSLIQKMEECDFERKITFDLIELTKREKKIYGNDHKLKITFLRKDSEAFEVQFEFIFAPKEFSNLKIFKVIVASDDRKSTSRYFLIQDDKVNNPGYKYIIMTYIQTRWVSQLFSEGYYDDFKATEYLKKMYKSRSSFREIMRLLKSDKKLNLGSTLAVNETIRNIFLDDVGIL